MNDFRLEDANITSESAAADLMKAMTADQVAGQQTWNTGTTGSGLKYESLDSTVKYLAGELEQMKLYRDLPKKKIFNTVHEFAQQSNFSQGRSAGLLEGEVPYENNSEYIRRVATTAYLGETRKVTDVMLQVNTILGSGEELVRQQVEDGIKSLTGRLNYVTANGNKNVVPTEFDGFGQMHYLGALGTISPTPTTYFDTRVNRALFDLRGNFLSESDLQDGATSLVQYGKGSGRNMRIYAPSTVFTGMVNNLTNTKFVNIGVTQSQTGYLGQAPSGMITTEGMIDFVSDIFLAKNPARYTTDPAQHANAPLTPTTPTIAAVADAAFTKFGGFAGNYYYAVAAVNRFGESALLPINTSVQAVLATQSVDLGFVDGGGTNLQATTGFVIYRSEVNPSGAYNATPLYPLFEISLSDKALGYDGGAAGVVRDRNRIIPNTEQAWLFQWDKNTIEFAELFGMRKIDLPYGYGNFMGRTVAILNYGMPLLYAPKRVIRFINIRKNA